MIASPPAVTALRPGAAAWVDGPMRGFDPLKSFGPRVAEHYDDRPRGDEDDAVAFLARLADSEPALEFAVGTGRIAVPLAERGIRVDGIELSAAMIERLRAKSNAEAMSVVQGDMATTSTGSRYGLVFLVYNTIFNLVTQEDQVLCFQNAAAHLGDGGRFVVEAALPGPLYNLSPQYVDAEAVEVDRVVLDVGRYDRVTQVLDESHVSISAEGIKLTPLVTRFAWPAELDLMARIAGLRLVERWGGWRGEPCTSDSPRHVSVYAR